MESQRILRYLGLPEDHQPTPDGQPIAFLSRHLRELPLDLLKQFSTLTSPKQRSEIATVRNRRFKFCDSDPAELRLHAARRTWPSLWEGSRMPVGANEGQEEKEWAEHEFMGGESQMYVGKLGKLLGDYEEEREAERSHLLKRAQIIRSTDFVPEEDESSDEEGVTQTQPEPPDIEAEQILFIRRIKERFIYGLLETSLYDRVDWDDTWDGEDLDRDAEERWFDEEENE